MPNSTGVQGTLSELLDRSVSLVGRRVRDEKRAAIEKAIAEQKITISIAAAERSHALPVVNTTVHLAVRISGFLAGVISYCEPSAHGARSHETTWYHVHTTILDAIDDVGATGIDPRLLAVLEVARGEISDAYRLGRHSEIDDRLPDECRLFFDALDVATDLVAPNTCRPDPGVPLEPGGRRATRSKYSGATERYPIDIRTCVLNDVRRYFPGQRVVVPDRVVKAVRATYMESIDQLVPEESHLLSGLLLSTPVLGFALRDGEFRPEAFLDDQLSFAPTDHPSWGYAWTVSLERMFFSDERDPTDVAKRVVSSRAFGAFELLDGVLESMARPWGHSNETIFYDRLKAACPRLVGDELAAADVVAGIRARSRIAQSIDPAFAWQQLGLYLDGADAVRAIAFSPWSVSGLRDSNEESQEQRLARGNVAENPSRLSREIVDRFEWLIRQDLPEKEFQQFLEQHPGLLSALGPYTRAVPHVVIHQDDGQMLIPDFFLECADRRGADLLELKLPSSRLDVRQSNRERFRATIHEAVAQLRTYRDWFRSAGHRRQFMAATGITSSFMPRALLVFGRATDFQDQLDRQRLEGTLPDWVKLHTYDDLLVSAREWTRNTK